MNDMVLQQALSSCSIIANLQDCQKLVHFAHELIKWNMVMNLTSITDESDIIWKHFVDSLIPLSYPGFLPTNARIIDIGSGAGFPGIPIALLRPDVHITLLDGNLKRTKFLNAVTRELGLVNTAVVRGRAEEIGHDMLYREHFDIAVSRAVASLPTLLEYALPFLKTNGRALLWKGPNVYSELIGGQSAAAVIGGIVDEPVLLAHQEYQSTRYIVSVRKITKTDSRYPRRAGIPEKRPLILQCG